MKIERISHHAETQDSYSFDSDDVNFDEDMMEENQIAIITADSPLKKSTQQS